MHTYRGKVSTNEQRNGYPGKEFTGTCFNTCSYAHTRGLGFNGQNYPFKFAENSGTLMSHLCKTMEVKYWASRKIAPQKLSTTEVLFCSTNTIQCKENNRLVCFV